MQRLSEHAETEVQRLRMLRETREDRFDSARLELMTQDEVDKMQLLERLAERQLSAEQLHRCYTI
jgi:hypothetical protein